MSVGLIALLDDVVSLAKVAAASLDDVAGQAAKASAKAAGAVIDDAAVTPSYVSGFTAKRELPIIGRIAWGSVKNKIVYLLPGALLLTAFAPFLIVPLLMMGGCYLAFEATEKIAEKLLHDHQHEDALTHAALDPHELEKLQVSGAVRTDLILSAEIMAIALANLEHLSLVKTAVALAAIALLITAGVYGVVALIVKLDDIGLHLARRSSRPARALGTAMVRIVPTALKALSGIGTAAMLWVGGGILLHGLEELHVLAALPAAIHHVAEMIAGGTGPLEGTAEWFVAAFASAIVGLVVGGMIVVIIRLFVRHPEKLITD